LELIAIAACSAYRGRTVTTGLQGFDMTSELTGFDPWSKGKRKFKVLNGILPIGLMLASFVPLFWFAGWLADRLDIPSGAPVKDQPNGLLWIVIFLTVMVVMMITGVLAGCLTNALICRLYLRWSWREVYAVHFKFQIPQRWLQELPPESGASPEAIVRSKLEKDQDAKEKHEVVDQGAISFIWRRGVLAWGLPMFGTFYVLPGIAGFLTLSLGSLLTHAAIWLVCSGGYGLANWWLFKRSIQTDKLKP
jgi:hypothetical protein